jgi:selenocysteine-specific elongation factor
VIIATAGHVDHGKTLLVHALTGIETDKLEEEKDRGLTIDLGFAYIDDELGGRLGFVDVPGHIKFINNMLAGVGAIDFALLVIAADDGPMPQTHEHLAILNQLGISSGAVALTKIDRVEPERVKEVKTEISNLLADTSLSNIEIHPLSSLTGEGIEDLKTSLCLTAAEIDAQATNGYFRLAIDRCFSVKGSGLVVTGSVFSGRIQEGDELYLVPRGDSVRVRGIHTQNQHATAAGAGDRCAINLAAHNLSREDISRGNWLTSNPQQQATNRFDVSVTNLGSSIRHWTPVHIHSAANHVTGRVATLEGGTIKSGEPGLVQIVTTEAINLCSGDTVILRDQGANRTIAGGKVLDPYSPARGRAKPERVEYLRALRDASTGDALKVMLEHASLGLSIIQCMNSLNLQPDELKDHLQSLSVSVLGDTAIMTHRLNILTDSLLSNLDTWHKENPQAKGLSQNQVANFLPRGCLITPHIIDRLVSKEALLKDGNTLARPGVSAQLTEQTKKLWKVIEPLLLKDLTKPPVLHELANQMSLEPKVLEKSLKECLQSGLLVRPVPNRYFVPQGIVELKNLLNEAATDSEFTVKEYRDVTGIGRNLCIEILEYFDRQGITQRLGDKRKILKENI